jgi:hypothetical protein
MRYFGINPSGGVVETETRAFPDDSWGITLYPNPARSRIEFKLNPGKAHRAPSGRSGASFQDFQTERIELRIYDISGRLIRSFALNPMPSALSWDRTDLQGRAVPAGVYFVSLTSGETREINKIILIK